MERLVYKHIWPNHKTNSVICWLSQLRYLSDFLGNFPVAEAGNYLHNKVIACIVGDRGVQVPKVHRYATFECVSEDKGF